jgi:hypothetical protein
VDEKQVPGRGDDQPVGDWGDVVRVTAQPKGDTHRIGAIPRRDDLHSHAQEANWTKLRSGIPRLLMETLLRIKRLVVRGRIRFTVKAYAEMDADDLGTVDVSESILNAQAIDKTLRSRGPARKSRTETLYVIKSFNYSGTLIYTKGKIAREPEGEVFYVLVSAKVATCNGGT